MAKALQSPAPAPQQLLAVWETSGHQRVLLGPSESQPGRPKAKIKKGALLHPLPSLLCAVTRVFLKRMACSPAHPHSWEGSLCKKGFWGNLGAGGCKAERFEEVCLDRTFCLSAGEGRACTCVCVCARMCAQAHVWTACTDSARTKSVHTGTPMCLCKQSLKASKNHCISVTGGQRRPTAPLGFQCLKLL